MLAISTSWVDAANLCGCSSGVAAAVWPALDGAGVPPPDVVPAELDGPEPLVVIAAVGELDPPLAVVGAVSPLVVVTEGASPAVVFGDVETEVVVAPLLLSGAGVVTVAELEGGGAVVVTSGSVVVTAGAAVVVTTGAVVVTAGAPVVVTTGAWVVVTICGASVITGACVTGVVSATVD